MNRIDRHPNRRGGTAITVEKGIPHNYADLLPLDSLDATGVCIPTGNRDIVLAAVYISAGRT
jgi:hypothetical protein